MSGAGDPIDVSLAHPTTPEIGLFVVAQPDKTIVGMRRVKIINFTFIVSLLKFLFSLNTPIIVLVNSSLFHPIL